MSTCIICQIPTTKYRCPSCFCRYCSVTCCKTHKESCVKKPDDSSEIQNSNLQPKVENDLIAREVDLLKQVAKNEDEEDDKVPEELLQLLEQSPDLKVLLGNPHLRGMLENLVNTDKPDKLMADAMHEPIFTEFADVCLKVVDKDNPNIEPLSGPVNE